jgi:hypothetical protein
LIIIVALPVLPLMPAVDPPLSVCDVLQHRSELNQKLIEIRGVQVATGEGAWLQESGWKCQLRDECSRGSDLSIWRGRFDESMRKSRNAGLIPFVKDVKDAVVERASKNQHK